MEACTNLKDLYRSILATRSRVVVERLIEDMDKSLREAFWVQRIYDVHSLDRTYIICHEQLALLEDDEKVREYHKEQAASIIAWGEKKARSNLKPRMEVRAITLDVESVPFDTWMEEREYTLNIVKLNFGAEHKAEYCATILYDAGGIVGYQDPNILFSDTGYGCTATEAVAHLIYQLNRSGPWNAVKVIDLDAKFSIDTKKVPRLTMPINCKELQECESNIVTT